MLGKRWINQEEELLICMKSNFISIHEKQCQSKKKKKIYFLSRENSLKIVITLYRDKYIQGCLEGDYRPIVLFYI